MIVGKFDPQSFFHRTENVALHVPASELFGLLKRTIDGARGYAVEDPDSLDAAAAALGAGPGL